MGSGRKKKNLQKRLKDRQPQVHEAALKDMTDTPLTYEEQQARAKREKEKRKRQAELDEAMLIGFMAGNMGSVYMMDAAAQAASE